MNYSQFIGATKTRAYLSVWSSARLFGSNEDIYSVALADLPKDIVDQIVAGRNPWAK